MGARGPAPKRRRLGHGAKDKQPEGVQTLPAKRVAPSTKPDAKWHPIAKMWFKAVTTSPQAELFQASDHALAYCIAEAMSREFMPQPITVGKGDAAHIVLQELPPKAAAMQAFLKGGSMLMATVGDRRRAQVDIRPEREQPDQASVTWLNDMRKRVNKNPTE